MSGTEKVMCVTGASGYIASWLVKLLLQRVYTVKASVRDLRLVIGPLLQKTLNLGAEMILNQTLKAQPLPTEPSFCVDVRDVANAHSQAFEVDSASGRYCLVGHVLHISDALDILGQLFPTLSINEKCEDDKPPRPTYKFLKEKPISLGINFTPLEVSLRDTVESLKEKGFFNF